MTWSRWEGAVAAAALLAWAHLQGMPALQKTCAQVVSTKGLLEKIVFLFFFFFFFKFSTLELAQCRFFILVTF